jgi:hypothetical protein
MVVPTKVLKENDYEIALMVFPIFEKEILYEFHLVEFYGSKSKTLKVKEYKSSVKPEK